MKTFVTAALLFASAAAQKVYDPELGSPQQAAAAMEAELLNVMEDDICYPDRPRPVRDGQRNRFNLLELSAYCEDSNGITYEWGGENGMDTADDCAEFCVVDVPEEALYQVLRGFEFNCGSGECRCLYDEGSINSSNAKSFRDSNYNNRSTKGKGSIEKTSGNTRSTGFACYKRVGAELIEEDVTSSLRGRN